MKFAFAADTNLFPDACLAVSNAIRCKAEFQKRNTNNGEYTPIISL